MKTSEGGLLFTKPITIRSRTMSASLTRILPRKSSPGIRKDSLKLELGQAVMQWLQSRHSRLSGMRPGKRFDVHEWPVSL